MSEYELHTRLLDNTRKRIADGVKKGKPVLLSPWTMDGERLAVDPVASVSPTTGPCHECGKSTHYTTTVDGARVHWCGCGDDLPMTD